MSFWSISFVVPKSQRLTSTKTKTQVCRLWSTSIFCRHQSMGSSSSNKKKKQSPSISSPRVDISAGNVSGEMKEKRHFKTLIVGPGPPTRKMNDPNQKVILLNEQDAADIHVSTHDSVLFIQLNEPSCVVEADSLTDFRAQLHAAKTFGMCQVQILRNTKKNESAAFSGPSWFMQTLFNSNKIDTSPTSIQKTMSPLRNDTSFTFTHLSTPSSKTSAQGISPHDSKRISAQQRVPLLIIPLKYILQLHQNLTDPIHIIGKAESITFTCIEPSLITFALNPSTLELLLLSFCNNLYFCDNECLLVSIQGQRVLFRITDIQQNNNTKIAPRPLIYQVYLETRIQVENKNHPIPSFHKLSLSTKTEQHRQQIVAGLDAILLEIYSYILPPLLCHTPYNWSWIQPPKGLLLHGPSGVGKSLIAQQIVLDLEWYNLQILREIEQAYDPFPPFHSMLQLHRKPTSIQWISCAYIQTMSSFVGEGEKILTRIFDQAQYKANKEETCCLIILDDVDLICPHRSFHGSSPVDRVASTLLALMDGIGKFQGKSVGNVFVLALSSKPTMLDPAFRRAGRIDKEMEVPIPDELGREKIYSFLLRHIHTDQGNIDPDILSVKHLALFAKLSKGFTGADCALSVKEAVRDAILNPSMANVVNLTVDHVQRAIRRTKPSSIKSIAVEVPCVPWSSIGGMSHVKQQLREAIEYPLKYGHLFKAMNIPPPKGILLYGPPGCSKTLMARALATEGQMNFLAVKGPELLSKWLGESERALASLFHRARMASPCVIFFDEIDAIGSKRGQSDGSNGGDRLLSQLLTELDGVTTTSVMNKYDDSGEPKEQPRVVVVGATNRPDLLDSALIRPGRIDRMIYVGLPDELSRVDIFRIALKNKACDIDVDAIELAKDQLSGGFSGAEIVSICQEAALFALEENDRKVESTSGPKLCRRHLMKSMLEKKRQITPEMLNFYECFERKL